MAPKKTGRVAGVGYQLYEKSIGIQGIVPVFYFGRLVEEEDVRHLAKLIRLGKELKLKEIQEMLGIKERRSKCVHTMNPYV